MVSMSLIDTSALNEAQAWQRLTQVASVKWKGCFEIAQAQYSATQMHTVRARTVVAWSESLVELSNLKACRV